MSYRDDSDRLFQEKMNGSGRVIISNLGEMVKNYYRTNFQKDGHFAFLPITYTFYDANFEVYNRVLQVNEKHPQYREGKIVMPFFLDSSFMEDERTFVLSIPGVIDPKNLKDEVLPLLPKGASLLSKDVLIEILLREGYVNPVFGNYSLNEFGCPDFELYAHPIVPGNTVDEETDYINFPQNVPEVEVCLALEQLFLNNKLSSRKVRYCTISSNGTLQPTDCFEEYSYLNRRFVRVLCNSDYEGVKKGKTYWVEVSPLAANTVIHSEMTTSSEKRK